MKPWNKQVETIINYRFPDTVCYIETEEELHEAMQISSLETIFFLHWGKKIPLVMLEKFKCIVFHMTDLPFGRGGSPLQNLILRGVEVTEISAIVANEKIDGGDILLKRPLALNGSAIDVFQRYASVSATMVIDLIEQTFEPVQQMEPAEGTMFERLDRSNNEMLLDLCLPQMFDRIRMVDAPTYPKAYLSLGNSILTLSRAEYGDNEIVGEFRIRDLDHPNPYGDDF